MKTKIVSLSVTALMIMHAVTVSAQLADLNGGPIGIERVAMCVGSPIPYISTPPKDNTPNWVQVDLGAVLPVEAVKLYPYFQDQGWPGAHSHNFPIRFRIEAASGESFDNPYMIIDQTTLDFIGYPLEIKTYKPSQPVSARYVR
ncbi:MAG: discoidin domain-containing protein, partial [Tannerella sp.]|nr:discoidin domain-containing protein [Tannerella sp.]